MYVMYVYIYNIELGQSFTLTTFPSIKHGPSYGSLPDGTWGIIPTGERQGHSDRKSPIPMCLFP